MRYISKFTPWQTPKEQLDAIFVARMPILDDLTERVMQAASERSHINTLLVGPRGAGKTHLIVMLYNRIEEEIGKGARVQIARMPEESITILSYSRLLAAIIEAVESKRKEGFPEETENEGLPRDYLDEDEDLLELRLGVIAKKGGVILVLLENLDEVFSQIGLDGQRKLRHLLQANNDLLFIATTSVLDRSMNSSASPFYSFFSVIRLSPLTVEQAQEMLSKIAKENGDTDLSDYLISDEAKNKLEVASYIAGSYPRVWAIFSKVLTKENLNKISDLLYESFNDLTPYYIDRIKALTPQQRLVVSKLASEDRPLNVQDISKRVKIAEKSVARTIMELKDAGWVEQVKTPWSHLLDKRKAYYELSEPLSRLAYQTKESFGRPIALIVNFLTVWFDPEKEDRENKGMMSDYISQVDFAFRNSETLSLTRNLAGLTRLPDYQIRDNMLLGEVDDALSKVQEGDAEAYMALKSQVRKAIEYRCSQCADGLDDGLMEARRLIHRDAIEHMGWLPREPQSSAWIKRGENLAGIKGEYEDLSIWANWLSRSKRFNQAENIIELIKNRREEYLSARGNLAYAYWSAGDLKKAIPMHEQNLKDRELILGKEHPDTLRARGNLANAYESAGDLKKAIPMHEQNLKDSELILGKEHPDTLTARSNLANAYWSVGDLKKAIPMYEQNLKDRELILGKEHPDTLTARNNLANAYWSAGDLKKAIPMYEQNLKDRELILGKEHPDTLSARNNLANAYWSTGDLKKAIPMHEQNLKDMELILGKEHPDTLSARNNLANAYMWAGDLEKAIPMLEQNLKDRELILGKEHPNTLRARGNLAGAYESAGDLKKAIPMFEQNLKDSELILGEEHPDTLRARGNLANAYKSAGDLKKV